MIKQSSTFIALLLGFAAGWELGPFERLESENPCLNVRTDTTFDCPLQRRAIHWESKDVFNPAAVVRHGLVHLLYRAEDHDGNLAGTSRVGLALSTDGVSFSLSDRRTTPVLFPAPDPYQRLEWQGGIEDPRVVESPDGLYVMTYTAYNGVARLCVATSRDLLTWEKHGPVFAAAHGGAFKDAWTKSGAIVCELSGDRLVAKKINGFYWMLWGENSIYMATSVDLLAWTPLLSESAPEYRGRPDQPKSTLKGLRPLVVFRPRRGSFDSSLVEPGPPAISTKNGIVFIYNAKNRWCNDMRDGKCRNGENDPTIPPGTYSAGQVLLDANDPTKVLNRTVHSFFKPQMNYEITGQVANVVFLEGLVFHRGEMLLYYGTADSKIAVARAPISSALHDNTAHNQVLPPTLIPLPAMQVPPPNTVPEGVLVGEGNLAPVPLFEPTTSRTSVHALEGDVLPPVPSVLLPSAANSWTTLLGCFMCIGGAALFLWMIARQRSKALRRRNLPCVPCLPVQAKLDHEL